MIEVGVRQDDGINQAGRNRSVPPVALAPFFLSLKESAVDENAKSGRVIHVVRRTDKVLGAGHDAGRAQKLDVGQSFSPAKRNLTAKIAEVRLQR